jgi:5-deoxy-glucuronate isomerase
MKLHFRSSSFSGFERIVSPDNSPLRCLSFGRIRLTRDLPTFRGNSGNREIVLDILHGTCKVEIEYEEGTFTWEILGERASPFDGPPTLIYIPIQSSFTITLLSEELEIAAAEGVTDAMKSPAVIRPGETQFREVGAANWFRMVNSGTVGSGKTSTLMVGETISPPGNWSSYPPHKHDKDHPSGETALEEVYFYLIDPPQGFAIQRLYEHDEPPGGLNEAFVVQDGDVIVLPRGYHPVVAAAGYRLFYVWALYGREESYGDWTDDPAHAWIHGLE